MASHFVIETYHSIVEYFQDGFVLRICEYQHVMMMMMKILQIVMMIVAGVLAGIPEPSGAAAPKENSVEWMLSHMRNNLGARYLLLEGGANINGQFLSADLVDEYFLTIGSQIVNNKNPLTPFSSNNYPSPEKSANLELLSVAANKKTDEVFLRYKIKH